jgi:hypothetical protein
MLAFQELIICQKEDKLLTSSEKAAQPVLVTDRDTTLLFPTTVPRLALGSIQTPTQFIPGGYNLGNETTIHVYLIPTARMRGVLLLRHLHDNGILPTYMGNFNQLPN